MCDSRVIPTVNKQLSYSVYLCLLVDGVVIDCVLALNINITLLSYIISKHELLYS